MICYEIIVRRYTTKIWGACVMKYRSDRKNNIFCKIYICFAALKEGFLQYRHIIRLDRCHLSCTSKGVLLTTVGIDLNNQMYQFAYAIVEKKNNDAWN